MTRDPSGQRPWLVMLSGSPWRAAAHRQHALARELARDVAGGFRVLFVDPPANRPSWRFSVEPVDESIWRAAVPSGLPFGRQLPPVNRLARAISAPLLRRWLAGQGGERVLWVDEDLAAPLIGRLGETAVIYDATDLDWTFTRSWNRWNLRRSLRAAVTGADLVLASSAALPPHLPGSRTSPVVVANGCDPDAFSPDGASAPWMRELPRPVVGYLGAIDTRAFDAELVAAVARRHPEWTFLLVGPASRSGSAPLAGIANVRLVDAVPFSDAPAVVRGCDVGIVPYRVGGLIDYVHPKKCFEYLAAGKPVVATALPALQSLDAPIRLASGPDDFGAAIGTALEHADCPDEIARRRAAASANTWRIRGDQVRELLAELGAQ